MVVLDGNFALGCGPGTDYPWINILQCMLERTDAITNEVLEQITFILAHPVVTIWSNSLCTILCLIPLRTTESIQLRVGKSGSPTKNTYNIKFFVVSLDQIPILRHRSVFRILVIVHGSHFASNNNNNNNNNYRNWVVTRWQWLFYMYTKYEIGY